MGSCSTSETFIESFMHVYYIVNQRGQLHQTIAFVVTVILVLLQPRFPLLKSILSEEFRPPVILTILAYTAFLLAFLLFLEYYFCAVSQESKFNDLLLPVDFQVNKRYHELDHTFQGISSTITRMGISSLFFNFSKIELYTIQKLINFLE